MSSDVATSGGSSAWVESGARARETLRAEGTGMGIGGVVAGREGVAAAASWGRWLGKRGAAAARGLVARAEGTEGVAGRAEGKEGVAGRAEGKGTEGVAGRAEGKEGVAGRAEGKVGLAGGTEGKVGVAGRAEGKVGVAGDGAVAAGVATPTPKAGKAEPGPRVEGPASRPKPDAAIGSARVAEHETLAGGARRRRDGEESEEGV
nr:unnamed protein product [Digitaria exilis]